MIDHDAPRAAGDEQTVTSTTSVTRNNQNAAQCDTSADDQTAFAMDNPLPYRAACLIGGGRSLAAVARVLHVHRSTIYRWFDQYPLMREIVRLNRMDSIQKCERTYDELTLRTLRSLQSAMDLGGLYAQYASTVVLRGMPTLFKRLPRVCRSAHDRPPESFPWVPERSTIGQRWPDSPRTGPCTKLPDL